MTRSQTGSARARSSTSPSADRRISMAMTGTPLTSELFQYLADLYWREDDVLRELTADLEAHGPTIQISPDEGRLLGLLVAMVNAERALEVGTLFGYSGIAIARSLPP